MSWRKRVSRLPIVGPGLIRLNAERHRVAARWRRVEKPYKGSVFDRLQGLEPLLSQCEGCTVLDFGSSDGLISYELARRGARLVHGFDIDGPRVRFARALFREVPVESCFTQSNLALDRHHFEQTHHELLRPAYDVVLYLGIHHHLKRQMSEDALRELVRFLAEKAQSWLAVRTDQLSEIDGLIRSEGFELIHAAKELPHVGLVHLYRRTSWLGAGPGGVS